MRVIAGALFVLAVASVLAFLPGRGGEAAWPGANGRIVYRDDNSPGIWTMDADGGNREQLTTGDDFFPTWSADGTKIAFQRGQVLLAHVDQVAPQGNCGATTVWTMDADGNNEQMIDFGETPSWSPDGTRIITGCSGVIVEMDATPGGGNVEVITQDPSVFDSFPVYRPGGGTIAFLRMDFGSAAAIAHTRTEFVAPPDVYIIAEDGSGATNVSNTPASYEGQPDWAPDGSALVFRSGEDIVTWAYSEPPGPTTPIRDGSIGDLGAPVYSPDGSRIAFTNGTPLVVGGDPGVQGIAPVVQSVWIMNADGSNAAPVPVAGTPLEFTPDWQPVANPTPTPSPSPTPTLSPSSTPTPSPSPTPTPAPTPSTQPLFIQRDLVWGDAQCDEAADPIDALLTLRHDAGLSVDTADCPSFGKDVEVLEIAAAGLAQGEGDHRAWGNVDCDDEISPIDSLKLLRFDAGLSVDEESGCPPVGAGVKVEYQLP